MPWQHGISHCAMEELNPWRTQFGCFRSLASSLVALTLIGQLAGAQWQKEAQLANAALQKISIKQISQGQVAGMPVRSKFPKQLRMRGIMDA